MQERELQCLELIKRIDDHFEKIANNSLQGLGITSSQLRLLITLSEHFEGQAALKELEHFFALSQATCAGIVMRAEKKGLVSGCSDENDRRIKLVRLTDEGRKVCNDLRRVMEEGEEIFLSPLEEDEQLLLRSFLSRLYENMRINKGMNI